MSDISQLIKKDYNSPNKYRNIFPKTYIGNVVDENSNTTLTEILSGFNMLFLPYVGNNRETRTQVPSFLRRKGLIITYIDNTSLISTERYNQDSIDDISWGDDYNWEKLYNTADYEIANNSYGFNVTVFGNKGGTHTIFTAIQDVPENLRVPGQSITFVESDGLWNTYQFQSTDINDYINPTKWVKLEGKNTGNIFVTNQPDEEDITSNNNLLQFADKEYNKEEFSGLGRIYLRKNIVGEKNILTQDNISSTNTIYIIQYDYDLNNQEITIPSGSILKFQGGSLSNGTIKGNNFTIEADYLIFHNIKFSEETANYITANLIWFVSKVYHDLENISNDSESSVDELEGVFNNTGLYKFFIPDGNYFVIKEPLHINKSIALYGEYKNFGNISINSNNNGFFNSAFICYSGITINSNYQNNIIIDKVNILVGSSDIAVLTINADSSMLWGVDINTNISSISGDPTEFLDDTIGIDIKATQQSIAFVKIGGCIKGLKYAYRFLKTGDNRINDITINGDTRCVVGNYPNYDVDGKIVVYGSHQPLQYYFSSDNEGAYFTGNNVVIIGDVWNVNTGDDKYTVEKIAQISSEGTFNKVSPHGNSDDKIYPRWFFNYRFRDYSNQLYTGAPNILNTAFSDNRHTCITSCDVKIDSTPISSLDVYNIQNIFGTSNYNLLYDINLIRYFKESYILFDSAASRDINISIIIDTKALGDADILLSMPLFVKYQNEFTLVISYSNDNNVFSKEKSYDVPYNKLYYKEASLRVKLFNSAARYVKILFSSTSTSSQYCMLPMIYLAAISGHSSIYASSTAPKFYNNSKGFSFFKSDLNKPVWWNGTEWVKADGTLSENKSSGTTSERPTNVPVGYQYFDTTINGPIWWNGTDWAQMGSGDEGSNVPITQEKGQSTSSVMSQKAVTNYIDRIAMGSIELGNSLDYSVLDSYNSYAKVGWYKLNGMNVTFTGGVPSGGLMLVTGDDTSHVIHQFIFADYNILDGKIQGHSDNRPSIIVRTYNLMGTIAGTEKGEWTPWRRYEDTFEFESPYSYQYFDNSLSIFWVHTLADSDNNLYRCLSGTAGNYIYKSSNHGLTWDTIIDGAVVNPDFFGDSCYGIFDNNELGTDTYIAGFKWVSEYELKYYKINTKDGRYQSSNVDYPKDSNDDNYILTGTILKYNNNFYAIGYNRAGNTFSTTGIWRKIAIFKVTPSTGALTFHKSLVDFTEAPGTPTSITSQAVFVDEPDAKILDGILYLVLRTVGNSHTEYNSGAFVTAFSMKSIEDPTIVTLKYNDFTGAPSATESENPKGAYICKGLSQGGHLNGILPRIIPFEDPVSKDTWLLIVCYVRNYPGTQASCLHYMLKRVGVPNSDIIYPLYPSFWKELSISNTFKIGKSCINTNNSSPEGGNLGVAVTDDGYICICCPSSRTSEVQTITMNTRHVIANL